MNPKDIDIHSVLPQREPFVAVEKLTEFSLEKAVTTTRVSKIPFFTRNGELTPEGIMENIAQTCAAKIGYYNKYILHKDLSIGVIGAVRHLKFLKAPGPDSIITTTITTLEEVFGMTLVKAQVRDQETLVAECDMKIAIRQNIDE